MTNVNLEYIPEYKNSHSIPTTTPSSTSDVVAACEIIKDRFYFATLRCKPRSTTRTHYFCTDQELTYENFYSDFGPLNLASIFRYCQKVNKKLKSYSLAKKKIVHYSSENPNFRVNAAFLAGCYQIIYLNKNAIDVYKLLVASKSETGQTKQSFHKTHISGPTKQVLTHKNSIYKAYRDAALGPPLYLLTLLDCLIAVEQAKAEKWLDFENFNVDEYDYYERVENGDLNWLIPGKFLAFCGPHNKSKIEDGYPLHAPEGYFALFRKYNVTDIVRLNKKMYQARRFTDAGFHHHDLFFIDGSCPSNEILSKFLKLCEKRLKPENDPDINPNCENPLTEHQGAISVHCKAGLGRTGTLIAAYMMKHYRWTAAASISWLRICRPGSVIGPQQIYLEDIQEQMWLEGDKYHNRQGPNINNSNNRLGLSGKKKIEQKQENTKLFQKVLQHETAVSPKGLTQGDRLRAVKAMTHKSPGSTPVREKRPGKERTISAVGGTRSKTPESGYGITTRSKSKVEENRNKQ